MTCRRGHSRILLVLALILGCATAVHAFRFEPISQDFAPSGPGANRLFRVINPGTERMAIRTTIHPRTVNRDGTEVIGPESSDFIVFPRQILLGPGETRSIRVRWQGPAPSGRELAFRIVAEQLPVDDGEDLPDQGGGVRLTYRYEGTVYVSPAGVRPDARVVETRREVRDGVEFLRIAVENSGGRHRILRDIRLALSDRPGAEPRLELSGRDLSGMLGQNVLAGATREFLLPVPDRLWDGEVYATLLPPD